MGPFDRVPLFFLVLGTSAGIVGALSLFFQLRKAVAAGSITAGQRRKAMLGWFLVAVLPFTLLEAVRAATNTDSYEMASWPAAPRIAAASVQVVTWLVILGWTLLRGGDVFLAAIARSSSPVLAGVTAARMRIAILCFAAVSLGSAAWQLIRGVAP